MIKKRNDLINRRMNEIKNEDTFFENLVSFCLLELDNRDHHPLPHRNFTTNMYRQSGTKVRNVMKDVVNRGLNYTLSIKKYKEPEDTNIRNYIEKGYLPSKWYGGM